MDEPSIVEQAKAEAEKLTKLNEETKANIRKLEELQSKMIMGGQTKVVPQDVPKKSTPREYAEALSRGVILPY